MGNGKAVLMLGSRKNNYLYYMKRSDLKELIKKSMLEVSPNSGAMTPEEEKMVADYEEEEANKYALGKEEPSLEEEMSRADKVLNRPSNSISFEQMGMIMMLADELGVNRQANEFLSGVVSRKAADEYIKQLIAKIDGDEGVLAEAEKIVAAYTKKKTLKEAAPSSANASKIAKLQKERDQIMHDMEQEAEPEGGPVADEYGAMLDKIDAQIRKLKGLKETASIKEEMTGGYLEIMEMNPKFDQGIEMLLEVWEEWKSGEMTEPEMIDEAKQDLLSYLSSVLD
jgi:hypothetical protein